MIGAWNYFIWNLIISAYKNIMWLLVSHPVCKELRNHLYIQTSKKSKKLKNRQLALALWDVALITKCVWVCVCVCVCVCWGWDRHLSPHQQAILQISARSCDSTQFWHCLLGELESDSLGSRLNLTRSPPAPPKEGKPWEALVKFRVQEPQLTGRPRPNHRALECHYSQN